jgi:hypothetical protein
MNEPTKYEAAVKQMLEENKNLLDQSDDKKTGEHTQPCPCAWCETERQNAEWEWQMKQDKIEQMHDFLGEREEEGEEE